MKRKALNVFLVAIGAAIGSVVTWKIVKTKYEQIAQEEIDSVKEEYRILMQKDKSVNEPTEEEFEDNSDECMDDEEDVFEPSKETIFEYHNLTSAYRSSENYADEENDQEGGSGDSDEAPYINGPYVISPDDFRCSPPGYNAQALDYYADGVLADGWGVKMDIEETIGYESLDHFGDYVDDIVYVRNDRTEVDYEITKDPRTYADSVSPGYN